MNRIRTVKLAVFLLFSPILMILLFSVTVFAHPVRQAHAQLPAGPPASLPVVVPPAGVPAGPLVSLPVVVLPEGVPPYPPPSLPVGPPAFLGVGVPGGPSLLSLLPGLNPFLDRQNPPPVLLAPGLNQ